MKVELKNVKHAVFASEDSDCFEATVYIDGKRMGTVSNGGYGGGNEYSSMELMRTLQAYAKTLPPIDCTTFGGTGTMPQSDETVIGDLFNEWLRQKEYKRMCKGKTVCRLPGEQYKDGEWSIFKAPCTPEFKARLTAKFGEGIVYLNDQLIAA